jgi:hypothetical protein
MYLPFGTLLVITPLSGTNTPVLTPYSARGLTQTYEPIKPSGQGNDWLRRDVNAVLRSLVDTRFQKLKTTITCKDGETPCLDSAWIGTEVMIDCVFELSYPLGASPSRPVVAGSSKSFGHITYYRPQLICLIKDIRAALAEYPALYDWQIDTEEK